MSKQGMGTAIETAGSDDMVSRAAQLHQDSRNGRHSAGGAVGSFRAFHGCHLPGQIQHCRIEMTTVDVEITIRS